MTCYVIAIAILCLTTLVNCQDSSQACLDASQALAASTSCQAAFGSIATAASDSPVCSGTCRMLIEDVYDSCGDLVCLV